MATSNLNSNLRSLVTHHLRFIGPGIIASVAYLDPGNWATDLEAGSTYGYSHLFVILIATLMAILLQILCTRLGYITGKDLAQLCRLKLYNKSQNTQLWRWLTLYPLYIICEIGIIFTDLGELIGSAMGLKMLIPNLPLWIGVLLTSLDVFIIIFTFNNYPNSNLNHSNRLFEILIGILVIIVLGSFIILLIKVKPNWIMTFKGFLPNQNIIQKGGLYQAIGIIGATVMPHALLLGSKIAIVDRSGRDEEGEAVDNKPVEELMVAEGSVLRSPPSQKRVWGTQHSLSSISRHLSHASYDLIMSLLTLALPVNAAILILASAAFSSEGQTVVVADLFSAHTLLKARLGPASAHLFALALLLSGQAASITVTMTGQIVSEGFLEWHTRPVVRRLVTRLVGIVPATIVAASVGVEGMDKLLVGSQVGLSLVLPFVIGPLLFLTSDQSLMTVQVIKEEEQFSTNKDSDLPLSAPFHDMGEDENEALLENRQVSEQSFANTLPIFLLTLMVMVIVCAANVYGIFQLSSE
ncbi:hypothetical protein CROQUDRAFT_664933 [Cronartium quercuum f. sp. fusiforme G11]|uniref:Natural resistance-associated macrophage protein n=1 Tax=Cronartium quercuum f. sp. fusiforme G11 TaxID=708437 RepID=A0A9P6NAA4_9BASI|nr:hypothetical protein CROQUDRAFT_664933 [Cronartium quercuum f. sp. fusiforme G11]